MANGFWGAYIRLQAFIRRLLITMFKTVKLARYFFSALLALSCSINWMVHSKTKFDFSEYNDPMRNWNKEAEFTANRNLKGTVTVAYDTTTGLLKTLTTEDKGADPQIIAEMVDIFLLQQPAKNTNGLGYVLRIEFTKLPKSESLTKVIIQNKNLANKAVILRGIPGPILERYPNIFSKGEIFNDKNFRALPIELSSVENLRIFRQPWIDFFTTHPKAKKEQLLEILKSVDAKYKSKYLSLQ
ncbi:MAG: hypothetical protein WCT03_10250 [Candidatus Obscuribacterales bacterium]